MNPNLVVELGRKYKDTITGFEGIATSRTSYLYGCARVVLQGMKLHEGKPIDPHAFDEYQLELVEEDTSQVGKKPEGAKNGGPGLIPSSRSIPSR